MMFFCRRCVCPPAPQPRWAPYDAWAPWRRTACGCGTSPTSDSARGERGVRHRGLVVPFSPLFWLGGFPYENRLQKKELVPLFYPLKSGGPSPNGGFPTHVLVDSYVAKSWVCYPPNNKPVEPNRGPLKKDMVFSDPCAGSSFDFVDCSLG